MTSTKDISDIVQKLLAEINEILSDNGASAMVAALTSIQSFCQTNLPVVEHIAMEVIDAIFAPKQLLKQLLLAVGLQGTVFLLQWLGNMASYGFSLCSASGRKMVSLKQQLGSAKTYMEWRCIAEQLDVVTGV
jgi:hypothetical protein